MTSSRRLKTCWTPSQKPKTDLTQRSSKQTVHLRKKRLDLENNKKFAEEDKLAKEKLSAAKTERKEEASAELAEEEGDKEADESFMRVLQKKCEDTAIEWDQRSVTRSSELTSIAKALEAL